MNPTIRLACESDTRSANDGNAKPASVRSRIGSEPPTTYAAHRLRDAKAASGIATSAATATAPLRPKTSGASE